MIYKKLLGITVSVMLILFATESDASKGLHADHLQNGIEMKKHKQPHENLPPLLPQKQHHRVDWNKVLNLSKRQQMQVDAIYNASAPAIAELREQIHDAYRKIGDIYMEDDQKIKEILDEQQKIKFDKYQYHRAKYAGEKPDGKRPSRKKMPVF